MGKSQTGMTRLYNTLTCKLLACTLAAFTSVISITARADNNDWEAPSSTALSVFDVGYTAQLNGVAVEADHQLRQLDNGQYQEVLEAKAALGKVTEQATFDLIDGQIVPGEYSYNRSIIGLKRKELQRFDWANLQMTFTRGKKTQQVEIQPGYMDKMTYKQQMRWHLAAGHEDLTYPVRSREKLKQYHFKLIGTEVLSTAIGPLNTTVIQRLTEDQSEQIKIWLATDWDYLLVKLEKRDEGEVQQMQISRGTLNDKPILPLTVDTEV